MMNKKILWAVILSLFIIVIALSVVCYSKTKTLEIVIKSCQEYVDFADVESDKLNEINSIGYDLDTVILYSLDGDLVSLSELVKDESRVFFRFSMTQCNSCVESQLEIISDICKDLSRLIIIVGREDNLRKVAILIKKYGINSQLYKLTTTHLPLPVDSLRKPYFYVLDNGMIPQNIFIPNKKFPNLSISYINRTLK